MHLMKGMTVRIHNYKMKGMTVKINMKKGITIKIKRTIKITIERFMSLGNVILYYR